MANGKLLPVVALCWMLHSGVYAQFAQLKIDSPEHDFGKVSRSQVLRHKFAVQNAGTSTLYIRGTTTD